MTTASKLKITPGEWKARKIAIHYAVESAERRITTVRFITGPNLDSKDDAAFIAEAGTVANETGLMPREMKEQRGELLTCLIEVEARMHRYGSGDVVFRSRIQAAIARAEGRAS